MSHAPATWSGRAALAYGLLGAPLAFVALPLYVLLPHHYATRHGVPLALLGLLLLGVRCADALVDPLLGRWADLLARRSRRGALLALCAAAIVIGAGYVALFFAPVHWSRPAVLAWCALWLAATCAAWSLAVVLHQAWGAALGGGEGEQSRWVAAREAAGLIGVVSASVLPSLAGLGLTAWVLGAALAAGWAALWRAPHAASAVAAPGPAAALWQPWRSPAFRRLLAVYVLNGMAGAVPATLVLFFVRDRLQAPPAWEGALLGAYFLAGALSLPGWVRAVQRWGGVRAWGLGMALSVLAFSGAALLGPGDAALFLVVCVASGLALGADLSIPAALLAALVDRRGLRGQAEGLYFGWWNAAAKLNLALAAGLALPLLGWAGYVPGSREAEGVAALGAAYALLPCVIKLLALGLLWRWLRPAAAPADSGPDRQMAPSAGGAGG